MSAQWRGWLDYRLHSVLASGISIPAPVRINVHYLRMSNTLLAFPKQFTSFVVLSHCLLFFDFSEVAPNVMKSDTYNTGVIVKT